MACTCLAASARFVARLLLQGRSLRAAVGLGCLLRTGLRGPELRAFVAARDAGASSAGLATLARPPSVAGASTCGAARVGGAAGTFGAARDAVASTTWVPPARFVVQRRSGVCWCFARRLRPPWVGLTLSRLWGCGHVVAARGAGRPPLVLDAVASGELRALGAARGAGRPPLGDLWRGSRRPMLCCPHVLSCTVLRSMSLLCLGQAGCAGRRAWCAPCRLGGLFSCSSLLGAS